jgi:4-amino-4-deoxy-L-arabinose transferase-like glycosyltransferase
MLIASVGKSELEARRRSFCVLTVVVAGLTAGLVAYSQLLALYGDEGFHLLASQLINAGKRPYLDFFYQHVPFYAYLNAGMFRLVGDSWRVAHVVSALCSGTAAWLAAGFVFERVRNPRWRLSVAVMTALLIGLNALVIQYGTVGHPFGLCLLSTVAAFRLVILTVERDNRWFAAAAGLCAGTAAASSLLTAPVAPILLCWILCYDRTGTRWPRAAWFLGGAVLPFLPLLWLAIQGPRQVFFNVVEYHLLYRQRYEATVVANVLDDLRTLFDLWLGSTQGLLLILLAGLGLLFLAGRDEWGEAERAELVLCGWLACGLGLFLSCTYPVWRQYFILVVPFLGILAAIGVYAIGTRVWRPSTWPVWLAVSVLVLFTLGLARPAIATGQTLLFFSNRWQHVEAIARAVNQVTPAGQEVYCSDEFVFFLSGRIPPTGLENSFSQDVHLPPGLAELLRVVPPDRLDRDLAAVRFATVVVEHDDPRVEAFELPRRYAGRRRIDTVEIFYGKVEGEKKVSP